MNLLVYFTKPPPRATIVLVTLLLLASTLTCFDCSEAGHEDLACRPRLCTPKCIECQISNSQNICNKCSPGYFLSSADYLVCRPCSENCAECTNEEGKCTLCDDGYSISLFSNSCVEATRKYIMISIIIVVGILVLLLIIILIMCCFKPKKRVSPKPSIVASPNKKSARSKRKELAQTQSPSRACTLEPNRTKRENYLDYHTSLTTEIFPLGDSLTAIMQRSIGPSALDSPSASVSTLPRLLPPLLIKQDEPESPATPNLDSHQVQNNESDWILTINIPSKRLQESKVYPNSSTNVLSDCKVNITPSEPKKNL